MANVSIKVLRNVLLQNVNCENEGWGYQDECDEQFQWTAQLAGSENPVEKIMKEHGLWEHDGVYEYDPSKLEALNNIARQYWDNVNVSEGDETEMREKWGVTMEDGTKYHSDSVMQDNLEAFMVVEMLVQYEKIKKGA